MIAHPERAADKRKDEQAHGTKARIAAIAYDASSSSASIAPFAAMMADTPQIDDPIDSRLISFGESPNAQPRAVISTIATASSNATQARLARLGGAEQEEFTRILREGDSGPDVTSLQERLRERHFSPGEIDGRFALGTEAAVMAFQQSAGLLADGIVGSRTARGLGCRAPEVPSILPSVTVTIVSKMFPATPIGKITRLPTVLGALVERELDEKKLVLMALATIRAEAGGLRADERAPFAVQ